MCEIKSGLMKGRVRLSELAGRREVKGEKTTASGGEVCKYEERMLGGEGRQDTQGFVLSAKRQTD